MDYCRKKCHNEADHHYCNHCGTGCTSSDCHNENCLKEFDKVKMHPVFICGCPTTSCICLDREPTKKEFMNHLVQVMICK